MRKKIFISILAIVVMVTSMQSLSYISFTAVAASDEASAEGVTVSYMEGSDLLYDLMETATTFVVAQHKALGGSHYAYTEGLFEDSQNDAPAGNEMSFCGRSRLVLLTLEAEGNRVKKTEKVLHTSTAGCFRDPDVSADGTKCLFSYKADLSDDFHIYEMDLTSPTYEYKQLTFGSGVADFECMYLPNGDILFSSSRAVQTVDCWITPVSNLYKMSADGSNIVRLGYDQVHTTYPTLTEDGRVIYTRWDYNDRIQLFVQGMFQMNPDGTNQTELYGNNSNFPTTLVHTRQVPGEQNTYISIATGHHTFQAGKLCMIDVSNERDGKDAISFPFNDGYVADNVDGYGQYGAMYQYPYPISKDQFLVSYCREGWTDGRVNTPFGLWLMDASTGEKIELIQGDQIYPSAQVVPVKTKEVFVRPSTVDYSKNTGTYYVGDVYQGEVMEGVERGTVKQIRVVALDYRPYAVGATESVIQSNGEEFGAAPFTPIATGNGSWDVKAVLGVATVYEDGSALFTVPSETPVYFQLLDENGDMIQTMRSWSTLMPNEIYSCVGCHENNNTAPPASATVTMALKAGVETLKPDAWQTDDSDYDPYTSKIGFDYLEEVQPILDANCVSCHNDKGEAYQKIQITKMKESGVSSVPATDAKKPFSLEGDNIGSERMSRFFPLSYLVLTNSTPRAEIQWMGNPDGRYVTWLSSMSAPELQPANTYGASVSRMMTILRKGHKDVSLTDTELRTLAAWIDLGVPAYGTYDANNDWNTVEKREAEEEQNKRDYYTMLNDYARMALAGTHPTGALYATYTNAKETVFYEAEGDGMVMLYVPRRLAEGDTVVVTLPEGVTHIGFTLNPKLGESIIYCPDGTFTYEIPPVGTLVTTMNKRYSYNANLITARVLTDEELAQKRNLAENVYDYVNNAGIPSDITNQYPHATASSEFSYNWGCLAKNAIDGFRNNKGHGTYPVQSWGPENTEIPWFEIDFGRPVMAEELGILIRYDLPHDTYFMSATVSVTYEDGTVDSQMIHIQCVSDEQIFKLKFDKPITSIRLKNLIAVQSDSWAAFTEVAVYGTEAKG